VSARAAAARLSTFAALTGRDYCLYWLGLVCYVLGHRAEYMTFAWITWEMSGDALTLGYLGLAQGVPLVLFQLYGGVLADRVNRLRLLIVTQAVIAVILGLAFCLTVSGRMRIEYLLALAALSSVFRAFDEPSRMALIPELVSRENLPNAIALGNIPWQAGRMVGPSLTGILIAAFGGSIGFALAAGTSCIALMLYARLRVSAGAPPDDGRHVGQQFAEGVGFVARNFVFASLVGLALFNSLFAMSYLTLLPIFADAYFKAGSTGYGLLSAAHGAGALCASLTIATLSHLILRRGTALLVGATCLGGLLMAFALVPTMAVALPVLVLVGFANTFYLTHVGTFLQEQVPDQLRGRVMSIYSLCWNLMPLGGLIAGALAAAVSARFAVLVGGAAVAVNALCLFTSRRLRAIS